MIFAPV